MSSTEDSENQNEEFLLTLDTIPPEIFLHICSFLSAKFVINVLSQVCQKFKEIIENDTTWRMRISEKWPRQYPMIAADSSFDWKEACISREEHYHLWKNSGESMKRYHLSDAHFGSVNVVQLLENGQICASGGRDGTLKLWDLAVLSQQQPDDLEFSDNNSCLLYSNAAHAGAWLWSIAYDNMNKMIYTGGFDCYLKTWNVEEPSVQVTCCSLASPILCLAYYDNALVSGCYGRSVSLFDLRADLQPVFQHIHHKKPVICIVCDEKYIISGSEDKTIIIYDKVARKIMKTIQFDAFPLCMSYGLGQLLVGDVGGSFHVIDPTHEKFELLQTYPSGHKMKVTGIQHSLGSIITCSTDKTIRVLEPNVDPGLIAVLERDAEISKISLFNTTLVSANTDDSITVWTPKEET
ncbi:F-box/WD repeat-containing protein 9-like [Stegodyphus dumicola]|uniref:F-box/WD repeat-containing protein 9-like n=1 Tax=Stegodyphus dumicola TaxID=202533 RepID=UPI0015B05342|nr:F-box/WD repeat-containing protein 9-like [Stegodyphus dumicola]